MQEQEEKQITMGEARESLEQLKQVTEEKLEEIQENPEAAIKAFFEDPKNKEEHEGSAQYLDQKFHGNWFTIEQVNKKTAWKNPEEARMVLQQLAFAGVVGFTENENKPGTLKYKVTLTDDARLKVTELEIIRLDAEKEVVYKQYLTKIESLKEKAIELKKKVAESKTYS